jgi:solute carrier family 25 carnitine/acylcarnitine transporter 20/29
MSGALEQLKGVISGGVGGMCLVLAGHPFDLVKTRLQTAAPGAYPGGALEVVRASLREGGARALFRGMSAPLLGVTPIFAICIWAYGVGKDVVRAASGARHDGELSLLQIGVAGALSAIPTTAVMAPGERIKVLLLVPRAPGLPPYAGPGDVVRQLVRAEGVSSLFRGSAITLLRDGVGSFAYFGAYEGIKRYTDSGNGGSSGGGAGGKAAPPSVLSVLAGGSAAGIANWLVALPCVEAGWRLPRGGAGERRERAAAPALAPLPQRSRRCPSVARPLPRAALSPRARTHIATHAHSARLGFAQV